MGITIAPPKTEYEHIPALHGLKKIRAERGLSLQKVADMTGTGMTRMHVRNLELGYVQQSTLRIVAGVRNIAIELGVEFAALVGGDDNNDGN